MKNVNRTIAAVAGSLGLALACAAAISTTAQAQPYGGSRYENRDRDARRPDSNRYPDHRNQLERERSRDDRRPIYRPDHRPAPPAVHVPAPRGRGVGPRHDWHRGGYVPAPYRGYSYVVGDWRAHRLYAPPRGYQWIQYGADYVLIAVGTGLIANIVINAY